LRTKFRAAAELVFEVHAHLMPVASRLEGVDAVFETLVQEVLEPGHGVKGYHVTVHFFGEVRKAA